MRRSQIRLLYKKDTEFDKRYPKNYRPIALLNVDYKILSKILFIKLKSVISDMISLDQYCLPNRYMGDLIHLISSTIHRANYENLNGFLMFIDFEKAFDSVNHEFMERALRAHGLPSEFIRWVMLAFTQTQACCIINGKRGPFFDLPGGGRQGDNLYPLIFSIVMQALNSLIASYNIDGIPLADGSVFKVKQYADDSTLAGATAADYTKIKAALKVFCDASGMRINWSKSILMRLGNFRANPFPIPAGDQISILQEGQLVRVLGVHLGHTQNRNNGWVRLKDRMRNVLNNMLLKVGNEIGDTITINAVLIGSCVFTAQYEAITKSNYEKIEKWATFFIRKRNYMTRDAMRYQSRHHGTPVPLIKLTDLVDTLLARWTHRILSCPSPPTYASNWIAEYGKIAAHLNYDSLDHLIMSTDEMPEISTTTKGFQIFTYYSLKAFKKMGFSRPIELTWEEIASQPIFSNPHIINPATNKPWEKDKSFAKKVHVKKLRYLWQLTNLDLDTYLLDPEVAPLGWATTITMNERMRHGNTRFNFTRHQWMSIIDSIPPQWQNVLLRGTQRRYVNEKFYATILDNQAGRHGAIGDVYQYRNGRLHWFEMDDQGYLTDLNQHAPPGAGTWPRLNRLKRLRVVTNSSADIESHRVISFMFMDPNNLRNPTAQRPQVFNTNVLVNSYSHPTIQSTTWRSLAKEWREARHQRHPKTAEFARHTFGDPRYDLHKLTTQFNLLTCDAKRCEMLWKIMNSALYIGVPGWEYQTEKKKIPVGSDKLTARYCVYSSHEFAHGYRPTHRDANAYPRNRVQLTYDYILWNSDTAKLVWQEADSLMNAMGIQPVTAGLRSYRDVFKHIETANLDEERTIIRTHVMLEVMWTLYESEKALSDLYKNGTNTEMKDEEIDRWPLKTVDKFSRRAVDIALSFRHIMRLVRSRKVRIHDKTLQDKRHYPKLSADERQLYEETWLKTNLVEIADGVLVAKLFHFFTP
jgi:hypothetical protein